VYWVGVIFLELLGVGYSGEIAPQVQQLIPKLLLSAEYPLSTLPTFLS
jgi:hypothetical protein